MLELLQRALEAIYGVYLPHRVEQFVVGPERLRALGASAKAAEELLVREGEGAIDVGLYVSPEVLARLPALRAANAHTFLGRLLPAFATAAEGVSHFLYLALGALGERTVSLAELEVQAEIDKFATSALLLWKHGERRRSADLRARLFDQVTFRADLSPEEQASYRHANRLGRGCAQFLERRFIATGALEGLLRELRRTYRLAAGAKFEYLAQWC